MPNEPALVAPTVSSFLTDCLIDAGVLGIDEAVEQPVLLRALTQLNRLLTEWERQRYLVYRLVDYAKVSTGAQTYSVGAGGDFNINPRPDRIESAFLRLLNNPQSVQLVDLPLDIIPSREDYNRIVIKNLGVTAAGTGGTIAWRIFYDPGQGAGQNATWTVGTLYPWPIPQASLYEIHVTFKETLARYSSLQSSMGNLPPEYQAALNWSLARRLRSTYQMPPDPEITSFARSALNQIRLANTAIPTMKMPRAVSGRRRAYDYHSDT